MSIRISEWHNILCAGMDCKWQFLVLSVQYGRTWTCVNHLKPSGYFMYCTSKFKIQQSYILHTQYTYVFRVIIRTNSDYFPIQHQLFGFYKLDRVCVLHSMNWIFRTISHPLTWQEKTNLDRHPIIHLKEYYLKFECSFYQYTAKDKWQSQWHFVWWHLFPVKTWISTMMHSSNKHQNSI
jgi:hypothetical protein